MKDSLRKIIQPYGARLISSNSMLKCQRQIQETKRKLLKRSHHIDIYLRINDPYSYLLVQVLADFEQRYDVQMTFRTILNLQQDMYPEEDMWHDNGYVDAEHLADLYQLEWPNENPAKASLRVQQGTQLLLQLENQQGDRCDWVGIERVFKQYWFQQPFDALAEDNLRGGTWEQRLAENEQTLTEQGHYMSAMLYYAGEWYWGLDRLDHLEKRLINLGLGGDTEVRFDQTYCNLCKSEPLLGAQFET